MSEAPELDEVRLKRRRPWWVWFIIGAVLALFLVPVGSIVSCIDGDTASSCTTTYVSVVGMLTGVGYSGF